jgi:uncharacterized protein YodC (DUF2158 family)
MADFQKGDVVTLKSGGPRMTVADVGDWTPQGPEDGVKCAWFDDKHKHMENVFDAATIQKYVAIPPMVF